MKTEQTNNEGLISVSLPPKYWVIVLAALNHLIQTGTKPQIERLREQGEAYKNLPPEEVTTLIGPTVAMGMIVDVLVKEGVMTQDAKEKAGTERLRKIIRAKAGDNP